MVQTRSNSGDTSHPPDPIAVQLAAIAESIDELQKYVAALKSQSNHRDRSGGGYGRYLFVGEAVWRLFAFDVHYRVPAVTRLPFHLTSQQQVIYDPGEDIEDVLTKTSNSASMFTGWMEANKNYHSARKLSYVEFPTQFVWKKQYHRNGYQAMLITCSLLRPDYLWDNTWHFLVDGILYYQQKKHKNPSLTLSDEQLKNLALLEIEVFRYQTIHLYGEIVLNVTSSGIASLLLVGGRTTHSRFLIPINLTEDSQCQVKGNTDVFDLLKKSSLIIWDEASMIHKHALEALDITLKDVMKGDLANTSESLWENGTRNNYVNATIGSSYIWSKCKVLKLTKNMRLTIGSQMSKNLEIKQLADWLLDIGEGNLGGPNDSEATISILDDLLIKHSIDHMSDLVDFVYPSMLERFNDLTYFQERHCFLP
ncbi:uncharacterized protein LOC143585446 [Bidens hawaiensis]|uniref:uncharacterized protein LOC143585446 n=1 Tax=Bidens hawaiensis TaxID=980011 RepID=UPI0040496D93